MTINSKLVELSTWLGDAFQRYEQTAQQLADDSATSAQDALSSAVAAEGWAAAATEAASNIAQVDTVPFTVTSFPCEVTLPSADWQVSDVYISGLAQEKDVSWNQAGNILTILNPSAIGLSGWYAYRITQTVTTTYGEIADGTVGTPGLRFSSDPDTGFFKAGGNSLGFAGGGVERVRFTPSGMTVAGLLSGTAVTQSTVDNTPGRLVKTGDNATAVLSGLGSLASQGAGSVSITGGSITDLSNLGVLNNSGSAIVNIKGADDAILHLTAGNSGNSILAMGDEADIFNAGLWYNHSTETLLFYSDNAPQAVLQSANFGIGTQTPNARLDVVGGDVYVGEPVDSFPANNSTGSGIVLSNTGLVTACRDDGPALGLGRNSSTGAIVNFHQAGAVVGRISVTGSATSYNTASDYRLKGDVKEIQGALDRFMKLRPVNFAWLVDDTRSDGFIAHEVQDVVPEAVTGEKDAVDENGTSVHQVLDHSKLVPLLTAALQEAISKIEVLESKVDMFTVSQEKSK